MEIRFLKLSQLALDRREKAVRSFQNDDTNCYRIFNGSEEGISGLIVERYGDLLIFQFHEGKCQLEEAELKDLAKFYSEQIGIKSVYLKKFVSDRSSVTADLSYYLNHPFWGEESPSKIICHENGMKFEIRPFEGFSTGIFLDQRNNRKFLRQNFAQKEVLNCFSYTCAFSVACALSLNHVTSVDLSKKYLDWGRTNFGLNGLKTEKHLFYCTEVFEQFKKARKFGKRYDLIILDPPSFSRDSKGKVFSVKKDMERLIRESAELLNPAGTLFVSSNLADWTTQTLKQLISKVLEENHIRVEWVQLPDVPEDFSKSEVFLSNCCFKKRS